METTQGPEAIIAHAPCGEILTWSEGARELYGWTPDEALNRPVFDLITTAFPEPYEDVLATLESKGSWRGLLLQRTKDGRDIGVKAQWMTQDGLIVQRCRQASPESNGLSIDTIASALLETFPGSAYLLDLARGKALLNKGLHLANLGYSSEEIYQLGDDLLPTLLHPDDLVARPARLAEYGQMAKGDVLESVTRIKAKDGSWRRVVSNVSVFAWDEGNNPTHIVGFAADVTEQHDAEQASLLAREQLRFALSASGMIAWIWDFATGQVTRVGDVASIYGKIEPTADAFFKAVHQEDWHLVDPNTHGSVMDGQFECAQLRIVRSDGQVRWVEERGTIQCDASGKPTHMVGVTIDITEQRRRDELNRRTHRSLRLALQTARASTWQWDCLTNLIVVSDDAFELFGLPRGAPPTMDAWLERIHPEDRNQFLIEARRTAVEGMDLCIDFRVQMPDGSEKPVRAVAQRATDDNGNATEVIGIVMDLSISRGLMRRPGEPDTWAA